MYGVLYVLLYICCVCVCPVYVQTVQVCRAPWWVIVPIDFMRGCAASCLKKKRKRRKRKPSDPLGRKRMAWPIGRFKGLRVIASQFLDFRSTDYCIHFVLHTNPRVVEISVIASLDGSVVTHCLLYVQLSTRTDSHECPRTLCDIFAFISHTYSVLYALQACTSHPSQAIHRV